VFQALFFREKKTLICLASALRGSSEPPQAVRRGYRPMVATNFIEHLKAQFLKSRIGCLEFEEELESLPELLHRS